MIKRHLYLFLIAIFPCIALAQSKPAHQEMLVTTSWLAQHLNGTNLVLVQVGPNQNEYDDGHIPGARFLPTEKLAAPRDGIKNELLNTDQLITNLEALGISNKSRIVIYTSQHPTVATRLYWTLDYLGIAAQASLLDGGLTRWKAEGRPLTKEAAFSYKQGKITPKLQPHLLVRLDEVSLASKSGAREMLLDSRPERRYLEGHIPGAISLGWQQTVESGDMNKLLDFQAIRAEYQKAGVRPGAQLIAYCETGYQATHTYFTAKYLGYKIKVYDGSYSEWNDVKRQPVVTGNNPR